MFSGLFTQIVFALLISFLGLLYTRKLALRIIPWLFFYLLIAAAHDVLTTDVVWGHAMKVARSHSV
jgi:hypothetical protein